jgi:hypothetical protein
MAAALQAAAEAVLLLRLPMALLQLQGSPKSASFASLLSFLAVPDLAD